MASIAFRNSSRRLLRAYFSKLGWQANVIWRIAFFNQLQVYPSWLWRSDLFRASLGNDIVTRLLVDHNGTLWAGTDDGLSRFDAVTEHFTTYKLEAQSGVPYIELVEDRQGKIWIGTESSGLRHFDPATGQFAEYEHNEK